MPLSTSGRFIVGTSGERVKLACVNWYGAHSDTFSVGGLEEQPLASIVTTIVELGFNCVRLPYSTEGQLYNPLIEDRFLSKNPELIGKRFQDVFDAVVEALTAAGLMVIPNNQNHKAGWCCYYLQDEGLWYVPGYTAEMWVDGLVNMTRRYRDNPLVVGMDLRNEVHDYKQVTLTWGTGDPKTDWALAATDAGNAVLAENPNILIVVNGLCFGNEMRPMRHHILKLAVPQRVVYEAHNYLEFNFWQAFSEVVLSWGDMRLITGFVCLMPVASLVFLSSTWRLLDSPPPPRRAVATTASCWLFSYAFISTVLCVAANIALRMLPGCGYWANRDVVPALWSCFAIGCLSGLFAIWVGCLFRFTPWTRCRPGVSRCFEAVGLLERQEVRRGPSVGDTTSDESDGEDEEDIDTAPSMRPVPMWAPGFASCSLARARWRARLRRRDPDGKPLAPQQEGRAVAAASDAQGARPLAWDCGLCIGLQCGLCCCTLLIVVLGFFIFAAIAPGYNMLKWHLDKQWGFLMEDGFAWTTPVWMGEFGSPVHGHYWNNLVKYLNDHDMDFAYWALNGRKWSTGFIDTMHGGRWVSQTGHWESDIFGLLDSDYKTVRYPWMMLDLRALQASPARWRPLRPYCARSVMGPSCGG